MKNLNYNLSGSRNIYCRFSENQVSKKILEIFRNCLRCYRFLPIFLLLGLFILRLAASGSANSWGLIIALAVLIIPQPHFGLYLTAFCIPFFGFHPGYFWLNWQDLIISLTILGLLKEFLLKKAVAPQAKKILPITSQQLLFFFLSFLFFCLSFASTLPALKSLFLITEPAQLASVFEDILIASETNHLYIFQSLWHLGLMILFSFSIINLVDSEKVFKNLLAVLFFSLLLTSSLALSHASGLLPVILTPAPVEDPIFGSFRRYCWPFGSPGWFAEYLGLALSLLIAPKLWLKAWLKIPLLVAALSSLILTFSRGGWLAFSLVLLALIFFYNPKRENAEGNSRNLKRIVSLAVLVLLGVIFILIFKFKPEWFWNCPLISKEIPYGFILSRLELWRVAWKIFLANPFLGCGIGSYWWNSAALIDNSIILALVFHSTAHNLFFQMLACGGLLGLISFLMILIYSFWIAGKIHTKSEALNIYFKWAIRLFILSFLADGLFQYMFYIHSLEIFFWMIISLPFCKALQPQGSQKMSRKPIIFIVIVIIITLTFTLLTYHLSKAVAPQERSAKLEETALGLYNWESLGERLRMDFRWSKQKASMLLEVKNNYLYLPIRALNPDLESKPLNVSVFINQNIYLEKTLNDKQIYGLELDLHDNLNRLVIISILLDHTWVPLEYNFGKDRRKLGIQIGRCYWLDKPISDRKNIIS